MEILRNMAIGQYIPGNSFVHRLDPRVKIIILFFMIFLLFIIKKISVYIPLVFLIFIVLSSSGISLRFVFKSLKPLFIFIMFTFVFNLFMTPGDIILWKWSFLKITSEGLDLSLTMSFRIILLIVCSSLITFTTSPIELTDGIESLLSPLTYFGFPSHELAMMMTIALRFIPILMEEIEKIMKAQASRGADFERGSFMNRIKNLIPIFVPLFVSTFRRADDLALAMEARCYRGGAYRTKMKELKIKVIDILAFIIVIAVILGLLYVEYFPVTYLNF